MLGRLTELVNNVNALNSDKILIRIYREPQIDLFIVNLNRIEQLLKEGVDDKGELIGLYAKDSGTSSFQGVTRVKKRNDPYTLYDTGDFYRSFDVIVKSDGFTIEADDVKEDGDKLTEKFGSGIIGLTTKSKDELAQKILPIIIGEVRKLLLK